MILINVTLPFFKAITTVNLVQETLRRRQQKKVGHTDVIAVDDVRTRRL